MRRLRRGCARLGRVVTPASAGRVGHLDDHPRTLVRDEEQAIPLLAPRQLAGLGGGVLVLVAEAGRDVVHQDMKPVLERAALDRRHLRERRLCVLDLERGTEGVDLGAQLVLALLDLQRE